MLIFDCTKDACDFFSHKAKGRIVSPVQPASAVPPDIAAAPASARWQIHVAWFGKTSVLAAMNVETRYLMLFVGLKPGDPDSFLAQFISRYAGEMVLMCLTLQLPIPEQATLQTHIDALETSLLDAHFFKRSDRSVQAHLNEVLGYAAYEAYEGKGLAVELNDLVAFDELMNRTPRGIRGGPLFFPAERHLPIAHALLGGGLTAAELSEVYRTKSR